MLSRLGEGSDSSNLLDRGLSGHTVKTASGAFYSRSIAKGIKLREGNYKKEYPVEPPKPMSGMGFRVSVGIHLARAVRS